MRLFQSDPNLYEPQAPEDTKDDVLSKRFLRLCQRFRKSEEQTKEISETIIRDLGTI